MIEIITYPFFIRALLAAILASIACGIIGTYIVSKRIVFISGGITHASFGGIGLGYFFGINPITGAAIFAIICATAIEALSRKTKMSIDSLIGIIWSFGMALGILFVYLTPGRAPDLMRYLFGSITTVSYSDILLITAITAAVIFIFVLLYREILYIAFDEEFATTRGISVGIINFIIMTLIALTVVITIRIVGIILVISLLTIPQVTSMVITSNFKKIIFFSIGFGLLSSLAGLIISTIYRDIPSGASIILSSILIFIIVKVIAVIYMKIKRREMIRQSLKG